MSVSVNAMSTKEFCQVKTNPKIREKLESGSVGQASFFSDFYIFFNVTRPLNINICERLISN